MKVNPNRRNSSGDTRPKKTSKCKSCPWIEECIKKMGPRYDGITPYCR